MKIVSLADQLLVEWTLLMEFVDQLLYHNDLKNKFVWEDLKALDTIGNLLRIIVSTKTYLVTSK